jgi:hypothetical protein
VCCDTKKKIKMEILRLKVGSKNEEMRGMLLSHDIDPGQLQDYHDLVPGQFQEHILLSLLYCFLGRVDCCLEWLMQG